MCQAEDKDTYLRFLDQGLPLESALEDSDMFKGWIHQQFKQGKIKEKQDVLDLLSFSYLARRVGSNPTYYDALPGQRDEALSRFVDRIWPVATSELVSDSALIVPAS